jgi:hypothetical protein
MAESAKIVHQALDRLEKMERADVHEKVPKRVKPPKSEIYSRSEAPRGQLGYYIVADGTGVNPYRVKVKSPCFTAMSVFHVLSRGMYIADIIALIGSLDVVLGRSTASGPLLRALSREVAGLAEGRAVRDHPRRPPADLHGRRDRSSTSTSSARSPASCRTGSGPRASAPMGCSRRSRTPSS